jgi:hypothetical protein
VMTGEWRFWAADGQVDEKLTGTYVEGKKQ